MDAKKIAQDAEGNLSIVMVDGRTFVHGSILDEEISKRNAEIERLRAVLDEAARDLQLGKPRNGVEERIRKSLNQQSESKE